MDTVVVDSDTPEPNLIVDNIVEARTGERNGSSSQVDTPDMPIRFPEKKRLHWAGKTCAFNRLGKFYLNSYIASRPRPINDGWESCRCLSTSPKVSRVLNYILFTAFPSSLCRFGSRYHLRRKLVISSTTFLPLIWKLLPFSGSRHLFPRRLKRRVVSGAPASIRVNLWDPSSRKQTRQPRSYRRSYSKRMRKQHRFRGSQLWLSY